MPLLKISTTATPDAAARGKLLAELSSLVARELGKPEAYVMTSLEPGIAMTFAGTSEPVCYAELKSIGRFTPELTQKLASLLCERLERGLGVPKNRIYLEFADSQGYLWGHDGDTFA